MIGLTPDWYSYSSRLTVIVGRTSKLALIRYQVQRMQGCHTACQVLESCAKQLEELWIRKCLMPNSFAASNPAKMNLPTSTTSNALSQHRSSYFWVVFSEARSDVDT